MARVVSLTLFLLSWLLLFSYAASDSKPSECQVCTEKVVKAFNHTDVADFVSKIGPQIDKLVNLVCYHLYPDVCPVETTSTKDGIPGQPLVPKPSNDAQIVNKDSDKGKKRKFPHTDVFYDQPYSAKTPSTKDITPSNDAKRVKNLKEENLPLYQGGMCWPVQYGPFAAQAMTKMKYWMPRKKDGRKVPNSKSPKSIKSEL